jgi:hypothetical protein
MLLLLLLLPVCDAQQHILMALRCYDGHKSSPISKTLKEISFFNFFFYFLGWRRRDGCTVGRTTCCEQSTRLE